MRFLCWQAGLGLGLSVAGEIRCDVTRFGAKGDELTLATLAINEAVRACHQSGGGVVFGTPESPIEDLTIQNLRLVVSAGPLTQDWGGNFDLRPSNPASKQLYRHDIPALFFRHAAGLRVDGVDVKWRGDLPDFYTSALEFERCTGRATGFSGSAAHSKLPTIVRYMSRVELR
jgi:hypothetical protein